VQLFRICGLSFLLLCLARIMQRYFFNMFFEMATKRINQRVASRSWLEYFFQRVKLNFSFLLFWLKLNLFHSFNNTNNSPALWQERCRGISQVQNILVLVTVMHFSD